MNSTRKKTEFFRALGHYLRERWRLAVLLLLFAGIFALVFTLYDLEAEAVVYASALCLFFLLVAAAADFISYFRRHQALLGAKQTVLLHLGDLPEVRSLLEEDYQVLLAELLREKARLVSLGDSTRADMLEYYTLWAHQIKTPIAAMRLLLESEAPNRQLLSAKLFEIEQYVEMVLSYLRLEGEGSDFVLRRYNLDDIIRGAVRKFAPLFIQKKISLDFRETHFQVLTDEKWLSFVLEQLLSNALKYTQQGAISLYGEGTATLVIADTGIGIAPEDLPRIFERGYTGYNGRIDRQATGLGLYLCRRILHQLGHGISIDSAVGRGTTVRLDLSVHHLEMND